jgi:hypothetical protein
MKAKQTEEEAIHETFVNYVLISIGAAIVLLVASIALYLMICEGLKITDSTEDVKKSRIILGVIFFVYVYMTYLSVDYIMKEYDRQIASIKEKRQMTISS